MAAVSPVVEPQTELTDDATLPPEALPNIEHLVTEDDTPVDNIFSEKQQRLLTESLYTSWAGPGEGRSFLALANVGLFYVVQQPPLVPDVLLSLDVQVADDVWAKANRSYLLWEFGKPPEVVIEIVSNKVGQEADYKFRQYANLGIAYYAIYDPIKQISDTRLRLYERRHTSYVEMSDLWLPGVELGLTLWPGNYEGKEDVWLRWCNRDKQVVLTGAEQAAQQKERANQEQARAEQEKERAEQEKERAEQEHRRAERLAAQLRALGIEPEA